jgi:predicted ribosome quality control (RQC) complex YloA/Tae2 family protein
MGLVFADEMERLFIISDIDSAEKLVMDILIFGDFQPEDPIYSTNLSRTEKCDEYLATIRDHLFKIKEIIDFYKIPYKKEGEIRFSNLGAVLMDLFNRSEEYESKIYDKILTERALKEEIITTYEEIEENRSEEKLIYLDKILSEEREISNYLKIAKKDTSGIMSLYNELLTMENYLKIMSKARRSEYFYFRRIYKK